MQWTVLIPAKALPEAKSRLVPASTGPGAHRRLVEAIRADTVEAARSAGGVARVLVVVDRGEPGPDVVVQTGSGLNAGLAEAATIAARRWPDDGIAVLVGDLPALRSSELDDALDLAGRHPRALVADRTGTGTTLLTALPGVALDPAFGAGSAARHARDAVVLDAGAGLRQDVDTAADLAAATDLGVGTATASALVDAGVAARSPCEGIMNR